MQALWPALRANLLAILVTGLAYPLLVLGLSRVLFAEQADGTLVRDGEVVRGSWLIGQSFTSERYFQGRPSAAGGGYDAASSGASNLAPSNAKWIESVHQRAREWQQKTGRTDPVPIELVTASGSGLDPHLSPAAARYQIPMVARARGLAPEALEQLIVEHTEGRTAGILGEERVNVLRLNLALDASSR